MEYVRFRAKHWRVVERATIHAEDWPRVAFQQSAYVWLLVILQTRAMSEKVYAEMAPVVAISKLEVDSRIRLLVVTVVLPASMPIRAIPLGRKKTPAPIIVLTRLKTVAETVALPVDAVTDEDEDGNSFVSFGDGVFSTNLSTRKSSSEFDDAAAKWMDGILRCFSGSKAGCCLLVRQRASAECTELDGERATSNHIAGAGRTTRWRNRMGKGDKGLSGC
jgi:hypothetical protein